MESEQIWRKVLVRAFAAAQSEQERNQIETFFLKGDLLVSDHRVLFCLFDRDTYLAFKPYFGQMVNDLKVILPNKDLSYSYVVAEDEMRKKMQKRMDKIKSMQELSSHPLPSVLTSQPLASDSDLPLFAAVSDQDLFQAPADLPSGEPALSNNSVEHPIYAALVSDGLNNIPSAFEDSDLGLMGTLNEAVPSLEKETLPSNAALNNASLSNVNNAALNNVSLNHAAPASLNQNTLVPANLAQNNVSQVQSEGLTSDLVQVDVSQQNKVFISEIEQSSKAQNTVLSNTVHEAVRVSNASAALLSEVTRKSVSDVPNSEASSVLPLDALQSVVAQNPSPEQSKTLVNAPSTSQAQPKASTYAHALDTYAQYNQGFTSNFAGGFAHGDYYLQNYAQSSPHMEMYYSQPPQATTSSASSVLSQSVSYSHQSTPVATQSIPASQHKTAVPAQSQTLVHSPVKSADQAENLAHIQARASLAVSTVEQASVQNMRQAQAGQAQLATPLIETASLATPSSIDASASLARSLAEDVSANLSATPSVDPISAGTLEYDLLQPQVITEPKLQPASKAEPNSQRAVQTAVPSLIPQERNVVAHDAPAQVMGGQPLLTANRIQQRELASSASRQEELLSSVASTLAAPEQYVFNQAQALDTLSPGSHVLATAGSLVQVSTTPTLGATQVSGPLVLESQVPAVAQVQQSMPVLPQTSYSVQGKLQVQDSVLASQPSLSHTQLGMGYSQSLAATTSQRTVQSLSSLQPTQSLQAAQSTQTAQALSALNPAQGVHTLSRPSSYMQEQSAYSWTPSAVVKNQSAPSLSVSLGYNASGTEQLGLTRKDGMSYVMSSRMSQCGGQISVPKPQQDMLAASRGSGFNNVTDWGSFNTQVTNSVNANVVTNGSASAFTDSAVINHSNSLVTHNSNVPVKEDIHTSAQADVSNTYTSSLADVPNGYNNIPAHSPNTRTSTSANVTTKAKVNAGPIVSNLEHTVAESHTAYGRSSLYQQESGANTFSSQQSTQIDDLAAAATHLSQMARSVVPKVIPISQYHGGVLGDYAANGRGEHYVASQKPQQPRANAQSLQPSQHVQGMSSQLSQASRQRVPNKSSGQSMSLNSSASLVQGTLMQDYGVVSGAQGYFTEIHTGLPSDVHATLDDQVVGKGGADGAIKATVVENVAESVETIPAVQVGWSNGDHSKLKGAGVELPVVQDKSQLQTTTQSNTYFKVKVHYPRAKDGSEIAGAPLNSELAKRMTEAENNAHKSIQEREEYDSGVNYATVQPERVPRRTFKDAKFIDVQEQKSKADENKQLYQQVAADLSLDKDPDGEVLKDTVLKHTPLLHQPNQLPLDPKDCLVDPNLPFTEQIDELQQMAVEMKSLVDLHYDNCAGCKEALQQAQTQRDRSSCQAELETQQKYLKNYKSKLDLCNTQLKWARESLAEEQSKQIGESKPNVTLAELSKTRSGLNANQINGGMPLPNEELIEAGPTTEEQLTFKGQKVNPFKTFANFVPSLETSNLLHTVKLLAADPGNPMYNPLYIYGKSGLGKTHILNAIANEVQANFPDVHVVFSRAEDFIFNYVVAVSGGKGRKNYHGSGLPNGRIGFNEQFKRCQVIIIDDIQNFSKAKQSREAFFDIIAEFMERPNCQLILASDVSPKTLEKGGFQARLTSRFGSGVCCEMSMPGISARRTITAAKGIELGIKLSETLIDYIAFNIQTNVREIEGAVKTLNTQIYNYGFISFDEAKRQLAPFIPPDRLSVQNTTGLSIDDIKSRVAFEFKVTVQDLESASKKKSISYARAMAMLVAKTLMPISLSDLGREFNKDHSSVSEAIKRMIKRLDTDQTLNNSFSGIVLELRDFSRNDKKLIENKSEEEEQINEDEYLLEEHNLE